MYGWQTKSWRNSTEKRQTDKERAAYTAAYLAERQRVGPRDILIPVCTCRSFRLPHHPDRHRELKNEFDWRTESQRGTVQYYQEAVK